LIVSLRQTPFAIVILILSLALTGIAWRYIARQAESEAKTIFLSETNAAREGIRRHLQAYIDALYGAQSLFTIHDNVHRAEWKEYIQSLGLFNRYPGIQGISFIRYLRQAERSAYEDQIRHDTTLHPEGYPGYSIRPPGVREDYMVVDYDDPFELFGFDIGSEPMRRATAERAGDSGEPMATGRLSLSGEEEKTLGFLMLMPVYRKGIAHHDAAGRRRALYGFISASFLMDDLMRGMLGDPRSHGFDLEIYDSIPAESAAQAVAPEHLLYDGDDTMEINDPGNPPRYDQVARLMVAGREWKLHFSSRPSVKSGQRERLPLFVLWGGTALSFLLSGMVWSLGVSRVRALDLAHAMTAELRNSHQEIRKLNETLEQRVIARTGELEAANQELQIEIGERKRAEDGLSFLANHDPLTALPNRVLFMDRLSQAMQRVRYHRRLVAVLFLDLDNFKQVNDTLGHGIGDLLLKAVSKRFENCVREGDTVARLGGDEFTLILENIAHADDVPKVTQKILEVFAAPFQIQGHELFITASIGISLYPQDGEDPETLVKYADSAMYLAKEQGRNNFQQFSPAINARGVERSALMNGLRKVLEREESRVHYQPQIDLQTGRIVGMEALARWNHPSLGLIPPSKFIPLAEEIGMIIPIGEWVLLSACMQNKRWLESGLGPLRIAVNISGRQFQQRNLLKMISSVLDETGLPASLLELELTESVLMHKDQNTTRTLYELYEMGIRFSVDDFGTGYSSLTYLQRFPIDTLKIDRSFVQDITTDASDAKIVTAIMTMAHSLDLRVVAEGVETAAQLDHLKRLKCDEAQGYFFSDPLDAKGATAFLAERNKKGAELTGLPG
jgi:diguanylate cyclase (GGDEF)-like protein